MSRVAQTDVGHSAPAIRRKRCEAGTLGWQRPQSAPRGCQAGTAWATAIGFLPVAYSVVNVDDVEGSGPGGAVRFMRRQLGVEAFGINWFDLPPGAEGKPHDESKSEQEEVLVVVRGSGHWRVDDNEVPARVGTFIRIDPESMRCPVAGPDGMSFVAIGARRGAYEPRGPF
jgi:quercetin dioxygenase-like cupin family protein